MGYAAKLGGASNSIPDSLNIIFGNYDGVSSSEYVSKQINCYTTLYNLFIFAPLYSKVDLTPSWNGNRGGSAIISYLTGEQINLVNNTKVTYTNISNLSNFQIRTSYLPTTTATSSGTVTFYN